MIELGLAWICKLASVLSDSRRFSSASGKFMINSAESFDTYHHVQQMLENQSFVTRARHFSNCIFRIAFPQLAHPVFSFWISYPCLTK